MNSAALEARVIFGQESWIVRSSTVEMAVTKLGGHMAPVRFAADSAAPIEPYAISPWQGKPDELPPPGPELPLRGDFFCIPFGRGPAPRGEKHPAHGQTSSGVWSCAGASSQSGTHTLTLTMDLPVREGKVTRSFTLHDGENAVYTETTIEGFAGATTLGHHAVLAMPAKEQALLVSTSPIVMGMTCPYPFGIAAEGNYQALAEGRRFTKLDKVPSLFRATPAVDCSAFPVRAGYTDLLQVAQRQSARQPAWTAAVNPESGYLWYSLKDCAVLPSTVFWIENKGRHNPPWNGRTSLLGLEDVCSYFDMGISAAMTANPFAQKGVRTFHRLSDRAPFVVRYIQGAVRVPARFGRVRSVEFAPGEAVFSDDAGRRARARVRHDFLWRNG